MNNLSPAQRKWWARLDQLIREKSIKDQNGLQAVMRQLALEVIAAQPYPDKIKVGDQTLRVFGKHQAFKTKAEFIECHRQNGRWGDDSLLSPLLEALGYQAFMHLHGTGIYPYALYEQENFCGLTIDIVNYGSMRGGAHWELKGKKTPGDGNCMYYAVAQQVERDIYFVAKQQDLWELAAYKMNTVPTKTSDIHRVLTQNQPALSSEEQAYFVERDKVDAAKEKEINTLLTAYSTDKLIAAYHTLKNPADDDTYLINRPKHCAQEQGTDFMQTAIDTEYWDKESEFLLREELVHALAKEAWRNPQAYETLLNNSKNTPIIHQLGFFSQKVPTPSYAAEARKKFTAAPTAVTTLA